MKLWDASMKQTQARAFFVTYVFSCVPPPFLEGNSPRRIFVVTFRGNHHVIIPMQRDFSGVKISMFTRISDN